MEQQSADNRTHFFSEFTGHVITIDPGHRTTNESGQSVIVGTKVVQFNPVGSLKFGTYATSDPDEIRALSQHPDVFGAEEFNRRSVPPEIQLQAAERTLQTKNRLIEQLEAENAKLKAAQQASGGPIKPPTSSK